MIQTLCWILVQYYLYKRKFAVSFKMSRLYDNKLYFEMWTFNVEIKFFTRSCWCLFLFESMFDFKLEH